MSIALLPPDTPQLMNRVLGTPAHTTRVIVRIAPLTVTPGFADWPISRRAAEECAATAASLVTTGHAKPELKSAATAEPHGRGVVATAEVSRGALQRADSTTAVADCAGVVGAATTRAKQTGATIVMLDEVVSSEITPMLRRLSTMLEFAEAYGRALCDMWLVLPGELPVYQATRRASRMHASGEIVIPADDDEVSALADLWRRELERNVGMPSFEPGGT